MALLCFETIKYFNLQPVDFAHDYIEKAGMSRVVTIARYSIAPSETVPSYSMNKRHRLDSYTGAVLKVNSITDYQNKVI